MQLEDLLIVLPDAAIRGDPGVAVRAVTADSRQAGPGVLFVAVAGTKLDGHRFVDEALRRGAAGAVVSDAEAVSGAGTRVVVEDTRSALALLALRLRGHPERRLRLVGVTGTNGKSTTAHLAAQLLEAAGEAQVGLLGTLGGRVGRRELPHSLTTPDAVTLADLLAAMVEAGARTAVMEVSSHALALDRVLGLRFRVAVFTNLSANEHLDFHGTIEEYRAAKLRLFSEHLGPGGTAVINAEDPAAGAFVRAAGARDVLTYGMALADGMPSAPLRLRAVEVRSSLQGSRFVLQAEGQEHRVELALPGRVNVSNALASFGVALALGVPLPDVLAAAPRLRPVRGRLEPVRQGQPFEVFVDFAHTPAALEALLCFARSQTLGRLIVCFGCGGDRDRSKRPLMGRAAACHADVVVLTSDNPRSEEPEAILDQIVPGLGDRPYHREADRRKAIELCLGMAGPGDVVILAGKGHEATQEGAGALLPFDDRAVAAQILQEMGYPA